MFADMIVIVLLSLFVVMAFYSMRKAKKTGKNCAGCPCAGECLSKENCSVRKKRKTE